MLVGVDGVRNQDENCKVQWGGTQWSRETDDVGDGLLLPYKQQIGCKEQFKMRIIGDVWKSSYIFKLAESPWVVTEQEEG